MAKEAENKFEIKSELDESIEDKDDKLEFGGIHKNAMAFLERQMISTIVPVNRRIKALKQLQLQQTNLESQFYIDLHELEAKYYKQYETYYDKRAKIITGEYEPNDEECVWESDEDEESLVNEVEDKLKVDVKEPEENKKPEDDDAGKDIKGVPEFWLTIFKNVSMLADMVQDHDEPILRHLYDIKTEYLDSGFKLEFHFSPNEYFSNSVLTKEYFMRFKPEEKDPLSYEGPEIIKAKGCLIDWKKGKNVTMKIVKKNQKHKSKGSTRTVTKYVQTDSFFNFFNPPTVPDDDAEIDEDIQALLNADFELGHYIRERIIQRAVLYYTGEALEDEDDDDYEEEEHDDEDDDIDDEEEEDETVRSNVNPQQNPNECKQQ